MRSHADIIEAFGGYAGLAEAIGVRPAMACHWARRGIPAKYWPDVEATRRAKRLGITAKLLRQLPKTSLVIAA
jgi:hypothetical protein